jgi:hypothetical protein
VTGTDDDPEAALAGFAAELARGVDAHLAGWVVRCVETRMAQWSGTVPEAVRDAAARAGEEARVEVAPQVAEALTLDIDDQPIPPLSVLRSAVVYPTGVLAAAGVPHVVRDEIDVRLFPEDVYGLAPATFADVHPSLHEPGLSWGAAKAFVHLARRRAEGRR